MVVTSRLSFSPPLLISDFFKFLCDHLYQSFIATSKALGKTPFFQLAVAYSFIPNYMANHTCFTCKPYIYVHSFLTWSGLKLVLPQAFYYLALGFSHHLLLKTCGKLHREMSALGNYLVAVLPEHLSTLQASKCLSLQHPCERGKCCNAICEVEG